MKTFCRRNFSVKFYRFFVRVLELIIFCSAVRAVDELGEGTTTEICNKTIADCTKINAAGLLNLTELGLDDKNGATGIGINLETLGNLTEIEQQLINDTEINRMANTSGIDDNRAAPGSTILAVIAKQQYDRYTTPNIINGVAVKVRMGLYVMSLSDFNNEALEYSLLIDMRMQWRDVRLKHTFQPYISIREKEIMEMLWRPDPYFVNEKDAEFVDVTFPNLRMTVFPDGLINYVIRLRLTPSCQMSFCRFPHDQQSCDVRISSFAYPNEFVEFDWFDEGALEVNPDMILPELQLQSYSTSKCVNEGKIVNASCLRATFEVQRSALSHIIRKFIPSLFALSFGWIGAYVPQTYQEVRVVTPVTILLTLKQLQRADDSLPVTSYMTAMDIWFSVVQIFTFLTLIESMLVYGVTRRMKHYDKLLVRVGEDRLREFYGKRMSNAKRYATYLDQISRIAFPILFVIFAIVYMTVIANGNQTSCMRIQRK